MHHQNLDRDLPRFNNWSSVQTPAAAHSLLESTDDDFNIHDIVRRQPSEGDKFNTSVLGEKAVSTNLKRLILYVYISLPLALNHSVAFAV